MNVPKLKEQDLAYFKELLGDIFPGFSAQIEIPKELMQAQEDYLKSINYSTKPEFMNKIHETYDMIQVRFGVCLIGNCQVGKSTIF